MQNVPVRDLQPDEICAYVQKKEGHKRTDEADERNRGCLHFHRVRAQQQVGRRVASRKAGSRHTEQFIAKVRQATAPTRFEICTDAFMPYGQAIRVILSDRVDYSQIVKVYDKPEEGRERYSPGRFVTVEKAAISGIRDLARASKSHVERQNGTLRQWCKRLTRLTYAFSKKWENLKAALALHFAYYNFCRVHCELRVTPAMETGISDHVWTITELIEGSI